MILIADSGSTKTDWRLINKEQQVVQLATNGLNPYYQDEQSMEDTIQKQLSPHIPAEITEIYFYGSGCSVESNCKKVESVLHQAFPQAKIAITHDLLAAARALCGRTPGIVCILGTGSNACMYDGSIITSEDSNLGFILGDEGSGGHLGKELLRGFFHKEMPDYLRDKFMKAYPVNRAEVLENVYKKPLANRYMASFTRFLFHNQRENYCYQLIYRCFAEFLDKYVLKMPNYSQYKIHFTGSIAYYYSNILQQVLLDKNLVMGNIQETPIAGLTLYHMPEEWSK
ncbi:MAG: N-acetylglucosamine kinase [Microscillaceae bacterium]|nr:N-acetylglucosamine kinase [Microscillaceae bacterium]